MLTAADRQEIKETIREGIRFNLLEMLQDDKEGLPPVIRRFIRAHEANCPIGKSIQRVRWIMIGFVAAAFLMGGGSVITALNFLKVF